MITDNTLPVRIFSTNSLLSTYSYSPSFTRRTHDKKLASIKYLENASNNTPSIIQCAYLIGYFAKNSVPETRRNFFKLVRMYLYPRRAWPVLAGSAGGRVESLTWICSVCTISCTQNKSRLSFQPVLPRNRRGRATPVYLYPLTVLNHLFLIAAARARGNLTRPSKLIKLINNKN